MKITTTKCDLCGNVISTPILCNVENRTVIKSIVLHTFDEEDVLEKINEDICRNCQAEIVQTIKRLSDKFGCT